ncbi:hypothetical protein AAFF_G00244000 [Aldrovandia affinis]|uniref:Uncharacterized protein n=1 Tax=Aldrovandia affinis TaxID=143900 RepID=A0AAD7W497_9TELE|nr:hypothetical protein AAFF_G00244000 [Aldrovandia affinis]
MNTKGAVLGETPPIRRSGGIAAGARRAPCYAQRGGARASHTVPGDGKPISHGAGPVPTQRQAWLPGGPGEEPAFPNEARRTGAVSLA